VAVPAPVPSPVGSASAAPATVPPAPAVASRSTASPAPAPGPTAQFILSAARTAPASAFPIGYVIGGALVLLGVAGGIYGQALRRRGRRPPPS
jgi:hypothetical protein